MPSEETLQLVLLNIALVVMSIGLIVNTLRLKRTRKELSQLRQQSARIPPNQESQMSTEDQRLSE